MAKNILIVDDEELVTKTLVRYLKTCGFQVTAVNSGKEAVSVAGKVPFDLIIADIRMPELNGIETIKQLRTVIQETHKCRVPEIIITGYASTQHQQEAKDLGVKEYIYKPFEITTFIEAVKRSLGD